MNLLGQDAENVLFQLQPKFVSLLMPLNLL